MGADQEPYDVAVVGGSYAGLSAALQLARARRRIVVVDAGFRRNRFAQTSHGFLGQDGQTPQVIAEVAKAQLLAYPTVHWHDGTAERAVPQEAGFALHLGSSGRLATRRLVLATGVVDELPDIPGLSERWGRHVFHCPYCHGYELNEGRIGVLATGAVSMHHALMLPDWGEVTLFTNGTLALDDAQRSALVARGVELEKSAVRGIVEAATIVLDDGRKLALEGLFTAPRARMASPIAEQLGCAFEEGPMGPFIRTDAFKLTSVAGVFACGDAARMAGSVALAVGDGALAGASAHQSLIFG